MKRKKALISTKKCKGCKKELSLKLFVDYYGVQNSKALYCIDCRENRDQELREKHFNQAFSLESKYIKSLKEHYGKDWSSKARPKILFLTLFMERDFCIYCGKSFKEDQDRKELVDITENYQIDYMEPLSLGGDDSIKNAVCVCATCKLQKGEQSFKSWADNLPEEYQSISQKVYLEKHGDSPNQFSFSKAT